MSDVAHTWALIGDSQAVGLEPHLREFFAAHGFALDGYIGNVGWSTSRFAATRAAVDVVQGRPSFVVVVLGGNDMPVDALRDKIRLVVAQLRTYGTPRIVWVGPAHSSVPEIQTRKREVDAQQRVMSGQLGFDWIDGGAMTADLPHTQDGVHFTREGSRTWARRLEQQIFGVHLLPTDPPSRVAAIIGTVGIVGMLGWLGWMIWRR